MLACGSARALRDQKLSKSQLPCAKYAYALGARRETATWRPASCKALASIF